VEIEILEYTVGKLEAQQKATNTFIGDVSEDIANYIKTANSLEKQLTVLNGKDEEVRTGRESDVKDMKERSNNNQKIIDALTDIIGKLGEAVLTEQGRPTMLAEVKRTQLVKRLKEELGENHPVALLVSLTSTFDPATVTRIIERMEHIKDATIALMGVEEEEEIKA
jgi:hypothetical protein